MQIQLLINLVPWTNLQKDANMIESKSKQDMKIKKNKNGVGKAFGI